MKSSVKFLLTLLVIAAVSYFAITEYVKRNIEYENIRYPLKYTHEVEKYSELYDVKQEIIYATILCESGFDAEAVSGKSAVGLMQLTPDTFEWLCTKTGEDSDKLDISDPETNIKYGTFFLSMLYEEFGDAKIAHAAYNAGRGRIKEWMKSSEYFKDGELYYIPFSETRNYVEKIRVATEKYANILEVKRNGRIIVQG
ncbi:MAG: lytic transglycosylase domain-containing protein [Clostridia bacterium]|nr:lytic transglycosylase domain-containing protein [Clostridia bacterium]